MEYHTTQADVDLEKRSAPKRRLNRKERRTLAARVRAQIAQLKRRGKLRENLDG